MTIKDIHKRKSVHLENCWRIEKERHLYISIYYICTFVSTYTYVYLDILISKPQIPQYLRFELPVIEPLNCLSMSKDSEEAMSYRHAKTTHSVRTSTHHGACTPQTIHEINRLNEDHERTDFPSQDTSLYRNAMCNETVEGYLSIQNTKELLHFLTLYTRESRHSLLIYEAERVI